MLLKLSYIIALVPLFHGQNNLCSFNSWHIISLFSISTKIFEHKLCFSSVNQEVYLELYHSVDYYFSRLSSLLLSGRPVQVKRYNFKEQFVMY